MLLRLTIVCFVISGQWICFPSDYFSVSYYEKCEVDDFRVVVYLVAFRPHTGDDDDFQKLAAFCSV